MGHGPGMASPGIIHADAVAVWTNRAAWDTRRPTVSGSAGTGSACDASSGAGEAWPRDGGRGMASPLRA